MTELYYCKSVQSLHLRNPDVDDVENLTVSFLSNFFGKIFMKIRSVLLGDVANRQTDRQTEKRRATHDLLGGGI